MNMRLQCSYTCISYSVNIRNIRLRSRCTILLRRSIPRIYPLHHIRQRKRDWVDIPRRMVITL